MATVATPAQDFPVPKFVEGGCLCGSLRYRVDFPEGHDFKKMSTNCQCTQCRKQSGALFWSCHSVKPIDRFQWTSDPSTLRAYRASSKAERTFCSNCGSWMTWKRIEHTENIEFSVGTIDEVYLIGDGTDRVQTGPGGEQQTIPKHGFGLALASGAGSHSFTENEIPGVTDNIPCLKN